MYDLIVVGAGSSGAVIASRATEDPSRTVLLIEAGPDYSGELPFDLVNSHNNSYRAHDWGFKFEPTKGRVQPLPRGKVTGGSSAVNTTIALRGMPGDFDEWAELGNAEWQWQSVLPYFNRLERDLDFGEKDYHGDAGPISIARYQGDAILPQHQAFLSAANTLGYPYCADANDPSGYGAGPQPMNKLGRLRISSAIGYLAQARARPNLTIMPNTFVRHLLIDKHKCIGVSVESGSGEVEQILGRTVVLSAGAIMTPSILMHSGLGPAKQLESLGIKVVEDIPGVGENLSDHPAISVVAEVKDPALVEPDQPIIQTILRYAGEGSNKRNDLQIEQLSFVMASKNNPSQPMFGIAAVLEYQYGRGHVRLTSNNPKVQPAIHGHFCEDERDAASLAACYREAIRFTKTQPIAEMIEKVHFPNFEAKNSDSDENLIKLVKRFSGSGYHPCGTAKMGNDAMSVVDQYGCCLKVDNLVIADASIMPFVPRANINLTCIMIGEKIGEWIRTHPGRYGL